MFHFIHGQRTSYGPQSLIHNTMIGILAQYQGNITPGSQGNFFLFHQIDDRTKVCHYYAFDTMEQCTQFSRFLKISGVGGKIAHLLTTIDQKILTDACNRMDASVLQALPGIGPKLAKKIIVELVDKADIGSISTTNPLQKKIITHLQQLGYAKEAVQGVIGKYPDTITDETFHDCFIRCIKELK